MQRLVEDLAADRARLRAGTGTSSVERRSYRPGEAAGYPWWSTATGGAAVDAQVVADAIAAGVLVNSADGDTPGTVTLPGRPPGRAPVTIGGLDRGTSPALARWLRDRIAADLPPELATLAELVERGPTAPARGRAARPKRSDWAAAPSSDGAPWWQPGALEEARARLLEPGGPSARRST